MEEIEKKKPGKLPLGLIGGGGTLLLITLALSAGGFDTIINGGVRKMMRLVPNSKIYKIWETIPIPVYYKVHLFNITNPEGVSIGEKAILKEMGPYTYLIDFEKHNITFDEEEDTLKYKEQKTYYFQPDMSNGKEDDMVTYINVVFVAVSHMANELIEVDFLLEKLDDMLSSKGEKLTKTSKVKDLLFDGVSIQPYVDLVNDPMVQAVGDVSLPDQFADGKFGLLKGKNGTNDGWWVVKTGISNYTEFGRVVSWRGKTKLEYWKADSCNAINGTDGKIYPPFRKPLEDPYMQVFGVDICRSFRWEYREQGVTNGVPINRYYLPDFKTAQEDPDQWCFCPKNDTQDCNLHGVQYISPCFGGAPMILTKPHFLAADESLIKNVEGLRPDPKKHDSWMDSFSFTGTTVKANIRLMFSVDLVPWPAMPSFANATKAMMPFAWVEQAAELDPTNTKMLIVQTAVIGNWPTIRIVLGVIAISLSGVGGFLFKKSRGSMKKTNSKNKTVSNEVIQVKEAEY